MNEHESKISLPSLPTNHMLFLLQQNSRFVCICSLQSFSLPLKHTLTRLSLPHSTKNILAKVKDDLYIAKFLVLVLFVPGLSATFDTVDPSTSLMPSSSQLASPTRSLIFSPASLASSLQSPLLVPSHLANFLTLECLRLRPLSSFLSSLTPSVISSSLLSSKYLLFANDFQIRIS